MPRACAFLECLGELDHDLERGERIARLKVSEGRSPSISDGDEGDSDGDGGKRASTVRVCSCKREIRVSAAEYLRGYIMCGLCGKPFLNPGESDEPADRVIWLGRSNAPRADRTEGRRYGRPDAYAAARFKIGALAVDLGTDRGPDQPGGSRVRFEPVTVVLDGSGSYEGQRDSFKA